MLKKLVIILGAGAALGFGQTPDPDDLFHRQDWAGAARGFQAMVEKDPGDGRAWFRLGSSLHRLGRIEESRGAFEKALDNRFQPLQAMSAIARSYAREGAVAQTVAWLDRAGQAGFAGIAFLDTDPDFAKVRSAPEFAKVREKIDRNAHPCMAQVEYRQLDFWLGDWDVQVNGQIIAASRIERMLDGCIVQENWMPFGGGQGKSWNFYNAAIGKWEQIWMAGGNVLKVAGTFHDGAMHYEGPGARLTFTPLSEGRVHQVWDQSTDGGKTWTNAFDGIYVPKKPTQ